MKSGDFPQGAKSSLDNYRGITLLSIFRKPFVGILLQGLQKCISKFEILNENQIAYRKGYQTSGHIFTLWAIMKHNFRVKKGPLLCLFC